MLLSMAGARAQQVSEIYEELPNPVATDASKWTKVTKPVIAWGSTDVRYNKELPAQAVPGTSMNLIGWMGLVTLAHLEASVATGFGSSS